MGFEGGILRRPIDFGFLKLNLNLTITLLSAGGCYLPFVMLVRTYQVLLLSTSQSSPVAVV